MGDQAGPANESDPTQQTPGPELPPPAGTGVESSVDATVDFRRDETRADSQGRRTPTGTPGEYPFLEPARNGDELGWLAHYRISQPIGAGGMGLVFRAEDTHLQRPVALKVIRPELAASPDAAARFTREARSAAAIKHDNVVTIYQVGEAQGVAFLAMEYLEGTSLARWLERGRKPSIDLILRIGREVASGLSAAHRLGLVHRDIKPANIWLEAPNGRVKILDFGQARAEREEVQITQLGAIVGSPAFMSPEQAEGKPVSFSTDLFSLGCVLYRLCSGRLPFEGKTILSVLHALATQTPATPQAIRPEIPESLSALVMRLLAKAPEARPESSQSVIDEIRSIERHLAVSRQRMNPGPGTADPGNTLENTDSKRKPADSTGASVSGPPSFRERRPIRLLLTAVGVAAILMSSALWFIRSPRFHRGPRPDFPPASRGFPGQSNPDMFVREDLPEEAPPAPASEPATRPVVPPRRPIEAEFPGKASEAPHEARKFPLAAPVAPPPGPSPPGADPTVTRPAPAVPAPPVSRPAESLKDSIPRTPEEVWGAFVDPDGDCTLQIDEVRQTARMHVPGTPHALAAELRPPRMNAPRTLLPVRGDFQVVVHVLGTERVSGRPTTAEYPPYHGAGILVWQDFGNYIRFEIATHIRGGRSSHYANFEYRQASRLDSRGKPSETGSAYLRLSRKGNAITASFSPDNVKWVPFAVLDTTLAPDVQVGLVAINSSTKPLTAVFEDFRVVTLPKREREPRP